MWLVADAEKRRTASSSMMTSAADSMASVYTFLTWVRRILVRRSGQKWIPFLGYDTRLWFPERERTLIRKWALSLLHRLDLIRVSQSKDFAFSNPRQEGSRKKICFRINWSRRRDLFPLGNEKDHISKNEIRRVHSVRALGLSLKEKEAGNSTIAKSKES